MEKNIRIVFMGTPEFATASLDALVKSNFTVAGVITAPDKPAGRGKKLTESSVKQFAIAHSLKVLQPTNLKDPAFIEEFRALNANLGIVVAFRMLPEVIWSMPEYGTFNLHASLLPQYRGAAPINHAVMNGEKETGVTTFFLTHEIDTGDVIFTEKMPIGDTDTVGEVNDRLMIIGAELVVKTVSAIKTDDYVLKNQNELLKEGVIVKEAPKIFKEDCMIKWQNPVEKIYNKIRGLSPYPAAFTVLKNAIGTNLVIKIYLSSFTMSETHTNCGTIETDNKNYLSIYGTNGKINILELQIAGKKRIDIKSFLNGFDISDGWKIEM